MSAILYRAFGADEHELLYVGATTQPGQRLHAHGREKDWWDDVTHITLEHFPTREEALAAEMQAIDLEQPRYNLSRPRRVLTPEEILERRQAREQRQDELRQRREEEEAASWRSDGSVVCANCGNKPHRLPRGALIVEMDCPTCGVPGLELTSKVAA